MSKDLLPLINQRQQKSSEFDYGIQTADRYVNTLATCVGSDLCYRYGSTRSTSFTDAVKRAAKTLTYSNPEMVLNDIYSEKMPEGIELPQNTLIVFKHVLTTPRKDRDGDILRTKGAQPDPAMLLLWQHVHTLPIGKALGVAHHDEKSLIMYSAVVDINELAQDAAVMIANKMGRFSHGFKALEFSAIKEGKEAAGKPTGDKGFDVTRFEIMEESLVSVPANVDAETLEVYLDLIEGEKLTSSIMKSYGKKLRATRSDRFPGMSLGEKDAKGDKADCGCGAPKDKPCGCHGKPTSEKTDDGDKSKSGDDAEDDEVEDTCPECGAPMVGGECEECGYSSEEPETDEEDKGKKTKGYFPNLTGSFEQIRDKLHQALRPYLESKGITPESKMEEGKGALVSPAPYFYCSIDSTFPDTVIAVVEGNGSTKYFEIKWRKTEADGVEFYDDPVEVVVTASVSRKKGYDGNKAGRVLSKSNYDTIKEVVGSMEEIHTHCSTRSGKALVSQCQASLKSVLDSAQREEDQPAPAVDKGVSFAEWLADSTPEDRSRIKSVLSAMDDVEATQKLTKSFRHSIKSGVATRHK